MRKNRLLSTMLLAALISISARCKKTSFTVNTCKPNGCTCPVNVRNLLEDINFGADGGLYAEMVENRSFEFPERLMDVE